MTLVRNLPSSGPTPMSVRELASPVIEVVVAFWARTVELEEVDTYSEEAMIRRLWERVEGLDDELAWMDRSYGAAWTALIPVIDEIAAVDLGDVATHLDGLTPDAVRAIVEESWHDHAECGDECDRPDVELGPAPEVKDRLVGALSAVQERLGDELAEFEPKQRHTLELIRFLKRRMPVEQLIETVTNGVAYHAEAGVSEIVLAPSALIRPWNLLFLFGSSRYIIHPISEDSVDADADTPPSWMLDLFKALGDERRLRILRRLREVDGATLGELVEYLDLAKSTTHHHLRTLRAAGLVRTRLVSGKSKEDTRYELRADLLPDVMGLVGEYLLGPADQTTD
ncbi:MAG: helix-turn-helix domain-containing protein [Acidimicrobiia bacterium]